MLIVVGLIPIYDVFSFADISEKDDQISLSVYNSFKLTKYSSLSYNHKEALK